MNIQINFSISEFTPSQWDALWPANYPFTKHGFLNGLEESNSVDTRLSTPTKNINLHDNHNTGWQPLFFSAWQNGKLIAAIPAYLKMHSYGEYVFDWSWANAYHQAGLEYYPKIVNAIPFTPATGPRIGFIPELPQQEQSNIYTQLVAAITEFSEQHQYSGYHCLFPNKRDAEYVNTPSFYQRLGYQFHWFNQNYQDFDHFLTFFSSRKRKNLRKERVKVQDQNIQINMQPAAEVRDEDWESFSQLYQITYLKRSGHGGYLGRNFFKLAAQALPENILLSTAHINDELVAAALYFKDDNTLYGRYWGSRVDIDGLHFECCYYQGIEYAIRHKLERFDPGAQGEHKIQRGFTPILTQSYHWMSDTSFQPAIRNFLAQEAIDVKRYVEDCRETLPFKEGTPTVAADVLTKCP